MNTQPSKRSEKFATLNAARNGSLLLSGLSKKRRRSYAIIGKQASALFVLGVVCGPHPEHMLRETRSVDKDHSTDSRKVWIRWRIEQASFLLIFGNNTFTGPLLLSPTQNLNSLILFRKAQLSLLLLLLQNLVNLSSLLLSK